VPEYATGIPRHTRSGMGMFPAMCSSAHIKAATMTPALQNQKPAPARNDKGQRETDQVRQIAASHGGKVSTTSSGAKHLVTISLFGNEDDPRLRAMMHAIEFATHGQFDRGRAYPGMIQYTAKSRFVDVVVRCVK